MLCSIILFEKLLAIAMKCHSDNMVNLPQTFVDGVLIYLSVLKIKVLTFRLLANITMFMNELQKSKLVAMHLSNNLSFKFKIRQVVSWR